MGLYVNSSPNTDRRSLHLNRLKPIHLLPRFLSRLPRLRAQALQIPVVPETLLPEQPQRRAEVFGPRANHARHTNPRAHVGNPSSSSRNVVGKHVGRALDVRETKCAVEIPGGPSDEAKHVQSSKACKEGVQSNPVIGLYAPFNPVLGI